MSLVLLTVFCSCGYVLAQNGQAIPTTFFGIHANNPQLVPNQSSYPLQVAYGEFRWWRMVFQNQLSNKQGWIYTARASPDLVRP